jgi:polyphosphate glucokinase
MQILGIDIGGTGIKHAVVDTVTGELLTERVTQLTPVPATPQAVAKDVVDIVKRWDWTGPVGYGFPARIKNGICKTAVNIEKEWIGLNVDKYFSDATGLPGFVANDADAAGLAELKFGAAKGHNGRVLLCTVGTGLGCAFLEKGRLIEGIEVFAIRLRKKLTIEKYMSNKSRMAEELTWEEWAKRVNEVFDQLDLIFAPDLFIIGGGIAKLSHEYGHMIDPGFNWVPAELKNAAGTIGAALWAKMQLANS